MIRSSVLLDFGTWAYAYGDSSTRGGAWQRNLTWAIGRETFSTPAGLIRNDT